MSIPELIFFDLDHRGQARQRKFLRECPGNEDGYYLIEHLIAVLDGKDQEVLSLDIAKKHMEIILRCRDKADQN